MKIFYQKNKKFNFVSVGRNGKLWTHCELVLEKKNYIHLEEII